MMRLAFEQSPVDAAWAAFDTAAIRLHVMYEQAAAEFDTMAESAERRELAHEVARLWKEWQTLFLGDDGEPRPAA